MVDNKPKATLIMGKRLIIRGYIAYQLADLVYTAPSTLQTDKSLDKQAPKSDFFQHPSSAEPSQSSLIHAMNNALGLPVLSVEEMFEAHGELTQAMKELGEEVYLGSDNAG